MKINELNYKQYLLEYLDKELDENEMQDVDDYIAIHQPAADEWAKLQKTVLKPETSIVFGNKNLLKKQEEAPVRKLYWYAGAASLAAAAVICFFVWVSYTGNSSLQPPHKTFASVIVKQDNNKANLLQTSSSVIVKTSNGKSIHSSSNLNIAARPAAPVKEAAANPANDNIASQPVKNITNSPDESNRSVAAVVNKTEAPVQPVPEIIKENNSSQNIVKAPEIAEVKAMASNGKSKPGLLNKIASKLGAKVSIQKKNDGDDNYLAFNFESKNISISEKIK